MEIGGVLEAQAQEWKSRVDRSIEDADSRNLNLFIDNRQHGGFPPRQRNFAVDHILKMITDLLGGSDGFDAFFKVQGCDGAAGLESFSFLLATLLEFLKGEPAGLLLLVFARRIGSAESGSDLLIFVSGEAALIAEVNHAPLKTSEAAEVGHAALTSEVASTEAWEAAPYAESSNTQSQTDAAQSQVPSALHAGHAHSWRGGFVN